MSSFGYKPFPPLHAPELARKYERQTKTPKAPQEAEESAKHLAIEFGRKSTIHAMNRIFQEHSNVYERLFWLTTLVVTFLGCIYVCIIVSQRFNAGVLQTVVDTTNKPVFEILFPEVAICNDNRLNWNRIEEAKALFMPNETDPEKVRLFELAIGLHDNLEFGVFQDFRNLEGEPLHLLNNINFSLVFNFMTWRCEELLTECVWHFKPQNCCEIFVRSRTLMGTCWHFNTLSTPESIAKQLANEKYPWRTGFSGPKSGLKLRALIHTDKHYRKNNRKGLLVSVMEPTVFHKDPYWIPADTETALEVEPIIYSYDNGTRSVQRPKRPCFFKDERSDPSAKYLAGFDYMRENCEAQCRQEYLIKFCNCSLNLLFPYSIYPLCRAEDLFCLGKYNEYFRFTYKTGEEKYVKTKIRGMLCNCLRNCYSLSFITDVRPSYLPRYVNSNLTVVDLNVYFRFDRMMVYRTGLVVTWVDLMVAFGGIAGLFLGCSLISGIELLYFIWMELPMFLYNKLKSERKLEKSIKLYKSELTNSYMSRKRRNWLSSNRIRNTSQMTERDLDAHEKTLYVK